MMKSDVGPANCPISLRAHAALRRGTGQPSHSGMFIQSRNPARPRMGRAAATLRAKFPLTEESFATF